MGFEILDFNLKTKRFGIDLMKNFFLGLFDEIYEDDDEDEEEEKERGRRRKIK